MRLILSLLVLSTLSTAPIIAAPIPPCGCGCQTTGSCKCKSCNEHTADPAWKGNARFEFKDYAAFKTAIEHGSRGYLAVGVANPFANAFIEHCTVPSKFCGLADGVYECFLFNGVASLQPYARPAAAISPCSGGSCPGGSCSAPARRGLFGRFR